MPDIRKNPDPTKDFICGKCKHYRLINLDDLYFYEGGAWVCKSEKANPDKKDIAFYNKNRCEHWEW